MCCELTTQPHVRRTCGARVASLISEVMPVGDYGTITEYNLQQLKSDVMNDKLFGYVECGIRVPEQ